MAAIVLWMGIYLFGARFIMPGFCKNGEMFGPHFKGEPPIKLDFSNSTFASTDCQVDGNPLPGLSWITQDGSPVRNVPGLRYSYVNGSLAFPAFKAEDYRQDIHAAIYQCVATSSVGTIKSRPVHVRAVVQQYYEVQVYDEFVIVGNTAVLKCNIPTFVKDYVTVAEWMKSGSTIIHSSPLGGNRYILTSSGDLYIYQVENSDSSETYSCKTIHRLSGEQRLSSPARIIVSDPKSSVPPRITHNIPVIQSQQGSSVEMPCAAQGQPTPTFRWVKDEGRESRPIQMNKRFKQIYGILLIDNVQITDSGTYLCIASNNIGEEKSETVLKITAPLSVKIEPADVSLDVGKSTTLNCVVNGYPITSVVWTKDGHPLKVNDRLRLLTQYILRIETVQREDKGMYQCFARNNDDVAQGSAELKLGDVGPMLHQTFESRILQPGFPISLQCRASGNPTPDIRWTLDETVIHSGGHVQLNNAIDNEGLRISSLNLSTTSAKDGGEYKCSANNRAGQADHSARIDIFGSPFIRPMPDISTVAGANLFLPCRAAGHPISSLSWEKDGNTLPMDRRQIVFPNGTLFIQNVDRNQDGGTYVCFARNDREEVAKQNVLVKITVPPIIDPMSFPQALVFRVGARARLQCVVSQGDLPLTISWLKNGKDLASDLNVQVRKEDEFSSVLTFPSISTRHNGNYTCIAKNSGGATNLTTQITIEVPPKWILQPSDTSTISGGNVSIDCVADGFPRPEITWKKSLGRHTGEYRDAALSSYRVVIRLNGSLTITGATEDDEGHYLCEANNGIGTGLSKVINLKVHASAYFDVKYQNKTAKKNDRITLQCEARGDTPIFVSWMKNNIPLNVDANSRLTKADHSIPHGLMSELTISPVERQDEGSYYCTTWNAYGRDESLIQLVIKEPPDVPDSVKIVDHGGRIVTLSWAQPYNGGSVITEYVVQFKRAADEWMSHLPNVTVPGKNTSAVVRGLSPGTPYSFRVLAKNLVGIGQPSNGVGITTAEEAPAGPPLDLNAKPIGPEAILISWKPPHPELSNGDILGYYVGYKAYNSSESYQYISTETNKGASIGLNLKIAKLKKFSKYILAVQAYNRMGKGPFSSEIMTSTEEDVPEKPPENVRCSGISSHNINVSWSPPNKLFQHGLVLGYKLFYVPIKEDEGNNQAKSVLKTSMLQATLHGLEKYTNYSVRALAFTKVGDGVSSDPVFCSTLEDVPGPPDDIKVLVKSATEVVVAWKPPLRPNGAIIKYFVYLRQPQERKQDTKRFSVDAQRLVLDIGNLKDNQRYEFWVTASTVVGEGQSTRVITQNPRFQVMAGIATFPSKIIGFWNSDVILPCPAVGIPLPRREWFKGNQRLSSSASTPITLTSDGSMILKQVQRSDSGNYSCRVENSHGRDEVVHQIFVQAPPDTPVAIVTKTTVSSVELNWKPQDDGGRPIKGYFIRYKREFGEWEEAKVDREFTSHTLQNLQCGTYYQITISAFNKIGPGHHSDVIVATTKGAAPGIPKMQDILFPNVSYAVLRLSNWPTGGCPIHYFVLQYKQAFQREWGLISNNVQKQHENVLISDLKPGERYELLVTAHNDAGSTKAKYEFTTLSGMLSQDRPAASGTEIQPFYLDITIIIPIVSSAITLMIILVGICIIVRRRRYAGYRHTKTSGHNDLTPDTDSSGERKNHLKRALHDQQMIKRNCNSNTIANEESKGGPDDICPYATSNLPGCTEDETAYSLQLKTFGHHEFNQRNEAKHPPPYPGKNNLYSSVISRSNTDAGKRRGIVLRPQRYPSAEEMYPTRSAATEYPSAPSPTSNSQRTHLFLLLDKKYGSDWDLRQTTGMPYVTQASPRLQEQTQVPDLLYRGTDSSTPNDSSPEEIRLNNCCRSNDVTPTNHQPMENQNSLFPFTMLSSVAAIENSQHYDDHLGISHHNMSGGRFHPVRHPNNKGLTEDYTIKV